MKYSIHALALAAALAASGCMRLVPKAEAPAPASAPADTSAKGDDARSSIKPYRTVVPATAVTDSGMFHLHKVGPKYYFEIPVSLLDKEMLLVSRIARTADNLGYGGEEANTQVVRWQRYDDKVLLRTVSYRNTAPDSLPISLAVSNSNVEPIIESFDIQAVSPDSSALVVEATALFGKDVPMLGLPRPVREKHKVRRRDDERSFVNWMKSFPRNVEVRVTDTYDAASPPSHGRTGTITVEMNHSMVLLPEDPMRPRLCDDRVGFFVVSQRDYGGQENRVDWRCYIARWRLEPSDTAAFLRGELVEPVKPIVYYIDPATPMKWRPFLKQGVEDWNEAFEAAGFKNAIVAKDPPSPEEDPEFSPEDVRYSVIRYFASPTQNAYGPHISDPRTGEILESDIGWYHNVQNLLRNWYLIQTAAANPEARKVTFDDEVMGELIRFVAAHEVGHTLGFPHNMQSSAAYPVDSLRSASFTCEMGTAPSIMDYARFNYVAQPEDEGVCFFPRIGPYDRWAAEWGYRPILEADTPEEEKPILNAWIKEHEEPIYRYGAGIWGAPSTFDPTSLSEALSDDAVKASRYGIANLKRILPNLLDWTYEEGESFGQTSELYGEVLKQWDRYMGHVVMLVGGVYHVSRTHDQGEAPYAMVPEARQREAVGFLAEQALRTPEWMLEEELLVRVGPVPAVERIRKLQVGVLHDLYTPTRMHRLVEAEARYGASSVYTLGELFDDVHGAVWSELGAGRAVDAYRRNLQRAYVERASWLLNEEFEKPRGTPFNTLSVDVNQSDIRAFARADLVALRGEVRAAIRRSRDRATRVHLLDVAERIDRALEPAS